MTEQSPQAVECLPVFATCLHWQARGDNVISWTDWYVADEESPPTEWESEPPDETIHVVRLSDAQATIDRLTRERDEALSKGAALELKDGFKRYRDAARKAEDELDALKASKEAAVEAMALPPLPKPFTVASTIKCTACGAPYEPARALAPMAAGAHIAWRVPPHACNCGNTQFGGTFSSENVSPAQYTADQMREYALATLRSRTIDVDAVMALADAYAENKSSSDLQHLEGWDDEIILQCREDCEAARAALRAAIAGGQACVSAK